MERSDPYGTLWCRTPPPGVRGRTAALLDQTRGSNVHLVGVVKRTSAPLLPIRNSTMLYTIAAILVGLWLLGQVTAFTMGGLIHALLVVAVIVVVLQVLQGRRKV